ncbi:hypothetical protein L596_014000 [Steinernema carpocapsae]|uniref:Uncharacterized protein n=1 Tax=Steinernema carpocapsae TaxID=34508 RepID=A0A4U5NA03_STECR|nr:hypothetical protein L596_014000 [Steinernema carpocapsae]
MQQNAEHEKKSRKQAVLPSPYTIPGPFEPLPGRSHYSDYWPLFPFSNQYSGGIDLDPSISRHIGGDINIPVPTWGILDITGRFFNRIRDTVTKFGYVSHPVNMLGLTKEDYVRLMSNPSLAFNRNNQPLIPLGKVPRANVPLSCRPPMCNPYTQTFTFGVDHDYGGQDGVEGDINVPIPIGKDLAYRFPIGGNIYYAPDNITVTYGHHMSPVDPYLNPMMFQNQAFIDGFQNVDLLPNRVKRSLPGMPVEYFVACGDATCGDALHGSSLVQNRSEGEKSSGETFNASKEENRGSTNVSPYIGATFLVIAPVFVMKVVLLLALLFSTSCGFLSFRRLKRGSDVQDSNEKAYYRFLNDLLKEEAQDLAKEREKAKKKEPAATVYQIPGPYEPLPGRSHSSDYWPVYPYGNAYMAGLELDPAQGQRVGGDINVAIPTWGMFDFSAKYFSRWRETVSKVGYLSHPVNMLGLNKEDFVYLMSDPSLAHNRNIQPLLPLGKIPRSNVPLSCRAPLCNPYTQTFAVGVEHDYGGRDGWNGDIDLPIPIAKDLAYRFPLQGNIYYAPDNLTMTYGHHASPADPFINPLMLGNRAFIESFKGIDDLSKSEYRRKRSIEMPIEYYIEKELEANLDSGEPSSYTSYNPVMTPNMGYWMRARRLAKRPYRYIFY